MIDFTNIEAAGVDKVILSENKEVAYLRPDISDPYTVSQISNSGTVDEITNCIDIKFSRDVSLGENYDQLKDDELEFSIKNFNKDNKAVIKRIQENRNGYIALIYFLNGDVTILQSPLYFSNESEKGFNSNHFVLSLKYRVKCGEFDLIKTDTVTPIQTLFKNSIDFTNNIIPDTFNLTDAAFIEGNALETDGGITIVKHASILSTTTVLSNKETATFNFYDGGFELLSGKISDLILSNGNHYPSAEGEGLILYDIVNNNHATIDRGFFDGFGYLSVIDTSTLSSLSNLNDICIHVRFKLPENPTDSTYLVFADEDEDVTKSFTRVLVNNSGGDTCLLFSVADLGVSVLRFGISSAALPITYFNDEAFHEIKIYIGDGNNRMNVDGTLYENTDLVFANGDVTTAIATLDVNGLTFANQPFSQNQYKLLISEVIMKSVDELTTYYSVSINGDVISASATTDYINVGGYVFDVWEKTTLNFANQRLGFEVYTDDATGLLKIYVPLNGINASLGISISGYTYQYTVNQNGNKFLNCETGFKLIEPIAQEIIDNDIYEFYQSLGVAKEIDFATMKAYMQNNITKIETDNSISEISLFEPVV